MGKGQHPKRPIELALKRAEAAGLKVEQRRQGHAWGRVVCPACRAFRSVWSTPRVPERHARDVDRFTLQHAPHAAGENHNDNQEVEG